MSKRRNLFFEGGISVEGSGEQVTKRSRSKPRTNSILGVELDQSDQCVIPRSMNTDKPVKINSPSCTNSRRYPVVRPRSRYAQTSITSNCGGTSGSHLGSQPNHMNSSNNTSFLPTANIGEDSSQLAFTEKNARDIFSKSYQEKWNHKATLPHLASIPKSKYAHSLKHEPLSEEEIEWAAQNLVDEIMLDDYIVDVSEREDIGGWGRGFIEPSYDTVHWEDLPEPDNDPGDGDIVLVNGERQIYHDLLLSYGLRTEEAEETQSSLYEEEGIGKAIKREVDLEHMTIIGRSKGNDWAIQILEDEQAQFEGHITNMNDIGNIDDEWRELRISIDLSMNHEYIPEDDEEEDWGFVEEDDQIEWAINTENKIKSSSINQEEIEWAFRYLVEEKKEEESYHYAAFERYGGDIDERYDYYMTHWFLDIEYEEVLKPKIEEERRVDWAINNEYQALNDIIDDINYHVEVYQRHDFYTDYGMDIYQDYPHLYLE
ncbi:uncharacterized protein L201_002175 [Kwoniella dendrophila CBS 6074]|uniref:Uncharacterized protein n=1 Tax=Kwoniella dendrophila CBS 6074 TaxID=1295534 RepID=A0AAX4JPJ7_9TREE